MRFIDAENFKLTQKPEYYKHYTYYDLIEEKFKKASRYSIFDQIINEKRFLF